jgi:hypothetical protein
MSAYSPATAMSAYSQAPANYALMPPPAFPPGGALMPPPAYPPSMQGMLWADMSANSANVAPAAAKKTNAYRPREGEKLLGIEDCILQVLIAQKIQVTRRQG